MKSIKHRLLSLLLTLVTILSLLPTAAFAASNTGSGLKITTNQAYWSTRLLANGTPYSYRPPLVDGKLVYCMDSGLGYHYATASYLNFYGLPAPVQMQMPYCSRRRQTVSSEMDGNDRWRMSSRMMTYSTTARNPTSASFMAWHRPTFGESIHKGEPGGDGDAGGYAVPTPTHAICI